ncbi:MAG: DUF5674 family protein [bacterium]
MPPLMSDTGDIVIIQQRIERALLLRLVAEQFRDMVKFVADVERGVIAIGGALHADGEQALLDDGSTQLDLWGANYYPGRGRGDCIEYTSLINVRPSHGNAGMEVADEAVRARIRALVFALVGEGEAL